MEKLYPNLLRHLGSFLSDIDVWALARVDKRLYSKIWLEMDSFWKMRYKSQSFDKQAKPCHINWHQHYFFKKHSCIVYNNRNSFCLTDNCKMISVGYYQLCLLKYNKKLEIYNYLNDSICLSSFLSIECNVKKISSRGPHLLLLMASHQLYGKGNNDCFELGKNLPPCISTLTKLDTQESIVTDISDSLYNIAYLCGENLYVNGLVKEKRENVKFFSLSSNKLGFINSNDQLYDEKGLLENNVKAVSCGCSFVASLSDKIRVYGKNVEMLNLMLSEFIVDSMDCSEYHLDFCSEGFLYRIRWNLGNNIEKLGRMKNVKIYSGGNYSMPVVGFLDFPF